MKRSSVPALAVSVILLSCALFPGSGGRPSAGGMDPAQSGVTGAIRGYVKDAETAAPVEKVKITLTSVNSEAVKFEIQTDKKGYYYIGGLTPGYYRFSYEKDGFLPAAQTWRARLAETVQADVALQTLEGSRLAGASKATQAAMASFKEAHWEEAVSGFSEGIASDPTNALLYFYRGLAREKQGRAEEAQADYLKAIELKPDFVLPYSSSAKIYAKQQDHEKASGLYEKAIVLGDRDITTFYNYAVVLMNLGKNPEARAALERLLALDPDYADAYYHLGILSIGQGETEKAKESLRRFLQLDPESTKAPLAKQILESLGK